MTRPDFVAATLDTIDANWRTANYSPKPILVDDRSSRRLDTGERDATIDLTENAVVRVNGPISTTNDPIGTEYDFDFRVRVSISAEAAHYHERGTIGSSTKPAAEDWNDFVAELRRAVNEDRQRPTSDPRVRHLQLDDQQDQSDGGRDLFSLGRIVVDYFGFEELP